MEQLDKDTLVLAFNTNNAKPLTELLKENDENLSFLFPEDYLFGESDEEKYREWINRILKPKIDKAKEEGQLILKAIKEVDLSENPELLIQAVNIFSSWYFDSEIDSEAVIALLIIVRKMFDKDKEKK